MTPDRDVEARLRRHLAAEADELPILLDAEMVRKRLGKRHRPWLSLAVPAVAVGLAVVVGQALLADRGQTDSGDSAGWGPLAVMNMNGGMDALTTGVLRITDDCVVLETAGGESELLVWPADRARWDAATRSIGFTNPDGSQSTLRDGEAVSFGGGGDSTAEGGVSGAEWAASLDWVSPPHPNCPMEIRWYLSEVADPEPPETPAPTPVPSADLSGIIRGEPELEGGICPVLLTDADRERWEVYLPEPYQREYRGDLIVIIGPEGEVIARTGDRVGFNIEHDESMGTFCMAGTPVRATEILVADALAVLGVEAERAEYSPDGAFMWAPLGNDSALFVHAFRTGADRGDLSLIRERIVAGITVQQVEYASGPVRDRFACEDVTYEVEGATPPGFTTIDELLAEFISVLGCASSAGE
jgi:hypothetical protein